MKKSRAVKIAGTFAVCLALARPGRAEFAYVANGSSNNVLGYTVNGATGALTPVAGSPFAAGTFPISVTVDPAGKFAYVTNELDNTISGYSINAATGALTPIAGSPFATGARPFSVVIDPTGKFAFVANANDNNLSGYAINAVTGALTPVPGWGHGVPRFMLCP